MRKEDTQSHDEGLYFLLVFHLPSVKTSFVVVWSAEVTERSPDLGLYRTVSSAAADRTVLPSGDMARQLIVVDTSTASADCARSRGPRSVLCSIEH